MTFRLFLEPADTLAISDGRPFNQNDAGRARAASVFPPPSDTVYGAARVACAQALGFPRIQWPSEQLGSWRNQGDFSIAGPYFQYVSRGGSTSDLLPMPAHAVALVAASSGSPQTIGIETLRPAGVPLDSDIGRVQLLEPKNRLENATVEPLTGRWGKADAVLGLLAGRSVTADEIGWPVDDIRHKKTTRLIPNKKCSLPGWSQDDLACTENRVGIARDNDTRHVKEGQLYSSVRRRLRPGIRMYVQVHGVDIAHDRFTGAVPLGGEARFAFVQASEPVQHQIVHDGNSERYLIYLSSPAIVKLPKPGQSIDGLSGKLIMAAISGDALRSGRSREKGKSRKNDSVHVLPAGSVLFMQGTPCSLPSTLGRFNHMGYGNYLMGVWDYG